MKPDFALDHIALGLPAISDAAPFLVETLGGREYGGGPNVPFVWQQWRFANGARIEVLEPAGPPGGFLHRFLESRGPGVHHVTFKVPDLEAAAEHARALGYGIVGWFDEDPSWKECFLHPKQAQGIVVQLAEESPRPSEDDPADAPNPATPEPPANAPGPVEVCALRLAARSQADALRQWQQTLGGDVEARDDGSLEFRYAGSPIRIVVEVRPEAEEGPVQIEFAAPEGHPLADPEAWPSAGREALGSRFVRLPR